MFINSKGGSNMKYRLRVVNCAETGGLEYLISLNGSFIELSGSMEWPAVEIESQLEHKFLSENKQYSGAFIVHKDTNGNLMKFELFYNSFPVAKFNLTSMAWQ